MRISIVAVGRLKNGPEQDIVARYVDRAKRVGGQIGLEFSDIREIPESQLPGADGRRDAEATALTRGFPERGRIIALDERGKDTGSVAFAEMLAAWRDDGVGDTLCVIGGPDGLDPELRRRADHVMAFGRATWPHLLARVMLCEQIYRATTILSGHPYHRV